MGSGRNPNPNQEIEMANNTFTDIVADIYLATQVVARESAGLTMSSMLNTSEELVPAQGDSIASVYVPPMTASTPTPGATMPNPAANTFKARKLTIDKLQSVPFKFGTEERKKLNNVSRGASGQNYDTVVGSAIEEAIRTLVNNIEQDLADTMASRCSLAHGTAGTTPFGSNLNDASAVRELLQLNGAPNGGRSLVVGYSAATNLLNQSSYRADTERTDDGTLRSGMLSDLFGFRVRETGANIAHSKTGGAKAVNLAAGYSVGDTSITMDGSGATPVAGDVVTIGSYNYVVAAGTTATTLVINAPGLRAAAADNATITTVGNHSKNYAFQSSVVEVAMRAPEPGGLATDHIVIQDPITGMVFGFTTYGGYLQDQIDVQSIYGTGVWQPEFCVQLLG